MKAGKLVFELPLVSTILHSYGCQGKSLLMSYSMNRKNSKSTLKSIDDLLQIFNKYFHKFNDKWGQDIDTNIINDSYTRWHIRIIYYLFHMCILILNELFILYSISETKVYARLESVCRYIFDSTSDKIILTERRVLDLKVHQ